MQTHPAPCRNLARRLADGPDTLSFPDALDCTPLDLLLALHDEVRAAWLDDLPRARRAAAAAALVAARFGHDPLVVAQAHWTQGNAVVFVPAYAEALAHYDAALAWYERARAAVAPALPARDIREVQIIRVGILAELGRYAEAWAAAETTLLWLETTANAPLRLPLLVNISTLAGNTGDYARMLRLADETIALARELDDANRLAYGWINRAVACIALGRFEEAHYALDAGLRIARVAGESVTAARALVNRAWALRCQGRLFDALVALRDAEATIAQAEGEAPTIALEAAALYEQLAQLPEALKESDFAAREYARQAMPAYSAAAALRAARIAVRAARRPAATRQLEQARAQLALADTPLLRAECDLVAAQLAALPDRHASAAALRRERKAAREAARHALARYAAAGLAAETVEARLALAALDALLGASGAARAAYSELARHPDLAVQLAAHSALGALLAPEQALEHLRAAAALVVLQRRMLPMEELQASYSSAGSSHQLALAAALLARARSGDALEVVWEAKGGALLDMRAAAGAGIGRALDAEKASIARLRHQRYERRLQARQKTDEGQSEAAAHHLAQAEAIGVELQAVERRLTAALQTEGGRLGHAELPGLAATQAAMPPRAALLEYALLGDELGCFLVRADAPPSFQRLGATSTLWPMLDQWNLVLRRATTGRSQHSDEPLVRQALEPMRRLLLDPWAAELAEVDELLLAPADALHHVPWALLAPRHLAALTLTLAGALWASTDLPSAREPAAPPRVLAHAGEGSRQLTHLDEEIAGILKAFPTASVQMSATAAHLRAAAPPRILHIAAHGETNPALPLSSSLELADGSFLLLEAHRLILRGSELVVLSACATGERPDRGDMALALVGAFLSAGARAVVASLWPVDDRATARLMGRFYAGLAGGKGPAVALRDAQSSGEGLPLDWAAFQLWAGAAE